MRRKFLLPGAIEKQNPWNIFEAAAFHIAPPFYLHAFPAARGDDAHVMYDYLNLEIP